MPKNRLFITYKHQEWTFGDKERLIPLLDGEDDYIIEEAATDMKFAIILRNGKTYKVKDNEEEAKKYIAVLYRYYKVDVNNDKDCYLKRDDPKIKYVSAGEAMNNGTYDYVLVPTGHYYLAREGKIIFTAPTEQEVLEYMYKHSGACYTYIC